uniref:Methyltranfer_dom domain-containing protein n=1 Tax=Schistosoma mansoni TaxID=6183 RepID=A0A5K4F363_SCHMA
MSSNSLNELIHDLLMFILEYNWIYNFQWIGDLCKIKKDSSNIHISSVIENIPTSWKNVLKNANLQELQMFVLDPSNLSHWPYDLLNLSMKCHQFTRLLSQYISIHSNKQFVGCYFNSSSMCTDIRLCNQINKLQKNYLLKMSNKKSYELKQISTLIQTILLSFMDTTTNTTATTTNNNNNNTTTTTTYPPPPLTTTTTNTNNNNNTTTTNTTTLPPPPSTTNTTTNTTNDNEFVNSSQEMFPCNEFLLNNEHIGDHFQTIPLISNELIENVIIKDRNSIIPLKIIDIGSGLGYLSNYIGYQLILNYGDFFTEPQIISVECNEDLHVKALKNLSQYNSLFQVKSLTSIVKRLLFRVESTNVDLLQTRLYQFTSGTNYLLLGLHCCGDLSQSMIELFQKDNSAQILLLVGCCYHKMTVKKFPTSDYLRKTMFNCNLNFIEKCISPATLRLACQHSPLKWLNWTELDANKHRIRVLARIILDLILIRYDNLSPIFEQYKRFDPVIQCDAIKKLLATNDHDNDMSDNHRSIHFNDVYPHIIICWQKYLTDILCSSQLTTSDLCFLEYYDYFEQIWNLIPGLLALQQLFQPLLETIVLFDRLWYLREYRNINGNNDQKDPYQYSGYIRIFDPVLSPRCMALLVCKNMEMYKDL